RWGCWGAYEHSPSGKHRMLIDYGPTLEDDSRQEEVAGNTITRVVLLSQQVRAVFETDSPSPTCASVNDQPTVDTPRSANCSSCSWSAYGSPCKEKTRLLLLDPDRDNPTPVSVFPLSPTSIKHWKRYLQRLAASKVPYLVMMTRFELQDVARNGFRWAEVVPVAERLVTPEELVFIKEVRAEYDRLLADVRRDDYSDPGDANDEK
ncbi:MAG: hypothetical protein K8F30_04490, partial [Taibaiella sp.]|nr:hypothetical protein [Taibaiella sp.]